MPPINYRHEVEQVYAGGAPTEPHLKELASKNIKHILCLDAGIASNIKPFIKEFDMEQIVIPVELSSSITDNIKYIKQRIKDIVSNNQPIYICCSDGTNRTGFVISIYKILKGIASPEEAINQAKKYKYGQGISTETEKNWNKFLYSLKPSSAPSQFEQEGTVKMDTSETNDTNYQHDITSLLKDIYRMNDITPAYYTMPSFAPRADIPYQAEDPNVFDNILNEDEDKIEKILQMGQYSNMAQTRGAGPVEGAGPLNIFQY